MADSNFSPATPVDIPLERSLYIGNIFRGMLLGEKSRNKEIMPLSLNRE